MSPNNQTIFTPTGRTSIQLNESFYEEPRTGSGFFPMLFRSDRYLKEEPDE